MKNHFLLTCTIQLAVYPLVIPSVDGTSLFTARSECWRACPKNIGFIPSKSIKMV